MWWSTRFVLALCCGDFSPFPNRGTVWFGNSNSSPRHWVRCVRAAYTNVVFCAFLPFQSSPRRALIFSRRPSVWRGSPVGGRSSVNAAARRLFAERNRNTWSYCCGFVSFAALFLRSGLRPRNRPGRWHAPSNGRLGRVAFRRGRPWTTPDSFGRSGRTRGQHRDG